MVLIPQYRPGIDAVGIAYSFVGDECGFLYWNGEKYEYEGCLDANEREQRAQERGQEKK